MASAALAATRARLRSLGSLGSAWRYSGGRRDQRLDLLRGYAIFVMTVDHIGGNSWLFVVTGGNGFFVSAAEGFVFIAGVVMGTIYAPIAARQGTRAVLHKSLKRGATLYVQMVLLTVAFAALSHQLGMSWAIDMTAADAPGWLGGILSLHQAYFMTDILLLYTFLFLAAGPLLVLFQRGLTPLILTASWALWALWQKAPESAQFPWPVADNGAFGVGAWQVIFVTGLALGFHREAVTRGLRRIPSQAALVASAAALAGLVLLYRNQFEVFAGSDLAALLVNQLFDKPDVRPGRLLAAVVVFTFVYTLVTLLWRPMRRALGWLLLPLGQHSLLAYSSQLFVLLAVTWLRGAYADWFNDTPEQNAVLQFACVLALWCVVMARLHGPALAQQAARSMTSTPPLPVSRPVLGVGMLVGAACLAIVFMTHPMATAAPDSGAATAVLDAPAEAPDLVLAILPEATTLAVSSPTFETIAIPSDGHVARSHLRHHRPGSGGPGL